MIEGFARKACAVAVGAAIVAVSALSSLGQEGTAQSAGAGVPCVAFLSTRSGNASLLSQASGLYRYSSDLFISNYDGIDLVNVTKDPASMPGAPLWSPDGSMLAWLSPMGIEVYSGHDKRTFVAKDRFTTQRFAWSPKSDAIAFFGARVVRGRTTLGTGAFIADLAGHEPTKLLDLPDAAAMCWIDSPNCVVVCAQDGRVLVAGVRSGAYVKVPNVPFRPERGDFAIDLAVSPDGLLGARSVAVEGMLNMRRIKLFRIDGGGSRLLLESSDIRQVFPSWSPADRNLMAFLGAKNGPQALYLYRMDSRTLKRVEPPKPYGMAGFYSWSSDGGRIAFQCGRSDKPEGAAANILILDVATMAVSPLADTPDTYDSYPAWRPQHVTRPSGGTNAPPIETTAPATQATAESTAASVESTVSAVESTGQRG